MKYEITFKFFSLIILAMLLSIPFMVADAYAINLVPYPNGEKVKITGATTDVEGYVKSGDTLVMEVMVEDDDAVFQDQVRFSSDMEFTRCVSSGSSTYKCTFEQPAFSIGLQQDFSLYLFEKAGSYAVPTSCSSALCTSTKKCKECINSVIMTDSSGPSSGTFSVVQTGTPEIQFTATDDETGIKSVEVYVTGVAQPVAVKDYQKEANGLYNKTVTDSISIANLAEGTYDFRVYFYDGLGNDLIKSLYDQEIDRSPPTITGWYINMAHQTGCFENPGLDVITTNDVSNAGISSRDVCVYVTFDNSGNIPANAEMRIRNLNTEFPNEGFEATFTHCTDSYCMFRSYDTGDDLKLLLQQPGGTTVSADFTVTDGSGNTASATLSKGIQRIDVSPVITSFSTPGFYNGKNYLGSDTATIVLEFNSSVSLDPNYIRLDASQLKTGETSVVPKYCDNQRCVWMIDDVTSTTSGAVFLEGPGALGPEDQFGNPLLPMEARTMNFIIDNERPMLDSISLNNIESDNEWTNDCVDRVALDYTTPVGGTVLTDDDGTGFCNNCTYVDPYNPDSNVKDTYCDTEHFWKPFSDSAYFTQGGYFDLRLRFTDNVAASRAFLNVSNVLHNGGLLEGVCNDVGETIECSWTSVGPLKKLVNPNDNFDVILTDLAGNMNRYQIPMSNYEVSANDVDFWNVDVASSSPTKLDSQLMSVYGLSQLHVLDLSCASNCGGAEVINVDVDCEPADPEMAGLIDTSTAYWHGSNVYLRLGYATIDVTEGDVIDLVCTLKTTTSVSSSAFGPEEDIVTIPITFFNSPVGTIDDSVQELINNTAAPWNSSIGISRLVAPLEEFFDVFRNICGVTQTLHNIYDYIATVNDLLKAVGWIDGGASQAATATVNVGFKGIVDTLAKWETTICKALTCEYCQTAINNPSSMLGGDGDELAAKAESTRKTLDNVKIGYKNDDGKFVLDAVDDITTCFSSFYGGDSKESGDGIGMQDGFDPADLCVPMGWAICLFQANSVVKLLNNPLQASKIDEFTEKYLPPEAQPISNSPEDSLIMSSLTMCIPGITHNLNKLRQIDCKYIKCLRDDVAAGDSTIAECDNTRNYATCQFVVGEGWGIMPLSGLFDQIGDIIENVIFDPSTWVKYAPGAVCYGICAVTAFPPGSCTTCHLTLKLMEGIDTITAYAIELSDMADADATFDDYAALFGWQSTVDECDGVLENELWMDGDDE